jgi:peptide subunit release factor 1 (eRF1)/transcriptional regulator with XRE-family HTH domain
MQLSKSDSVKLYKIRKVISELSKKEGRGTELVSLYIPPKKPIHEVIANLREEWGTAGNIKSDTTRNHVQNALVKTMQRLKLYKETPDNGLVIFCGALPTNGPGSEVVKLTEIVPPKSISMYLYKCDDHFQLEQLKDMLKEERVYGILSIDATETGLGILRGDRLEIEDVITSGVSGKTRKGGQCVSQDTLVQLEDGRLFPIDHITPGSRIASYDFEKHALGMHESDDVFTKVPKEYLVVETTRPKSEILVTGEHRFFKFTSEGFTTVHASELRKGDKVIVVRKLPEPEDPVLDTGFPSSYRYNVSEEGRRLIREKRVSKGLSQAKVAAKLELHQTEISQLERGARNLESSKLLRVVSFLFKDTENFQKEFIETKRVLPEFHTEDLLQLLGYIAGDGNVDANSVVLYEERAEIAQLYSRLARQSLELPSYPPLRVVDKVGKKGSFAKDKFFEVRIYSKVFTDALKQYYPELVSIGLRSVPERLHRLDNQNLARFLKGLFDAEGFALALRVGINMKSELLIKQLRLLLLRFGIVSSYRKYVNVYGSLMHSLSIGDYDSLQRFLDSIGFSASDKEATLQRATAKSHRQRYLNVPIVGSWVNERAKTLGIRRKRFAGVTNFFIDQRGVSHAVFRRIVQIFEDELISVGSIDAPSRRIQLLRGMVSNLGMIESDLMFATVKRIERVKNSAKEKFIDIELPITRSFVGDGFVLHNSARRYERLRNMELTYYYNRVGEHATRVFLNNNNISGIIVGGPGPTKDEFLKSEYLHYQLQENVVAVLDTSYSGREGVREILSKASDILQGVRLVEEKKLVQRFLAEVNKQNSLAIYGLPKVMEALDRANAEIVLVSDDIDTASITTVCKNCKIMKEQIVQNQKRVQVMQEMISKACEECGATNYDADERDIVDVLEDKAIQIGAKVEMISSGTEEGSMFKSFGGIAAFLRYRV